MSPTVLRALPSSSRIAPFVERVSVVAARPAPEIVTLFAPEPSCLKPAAVA